MHLILICIFFGTQTCLCRLQNWPYFDVCKYARALTQKVCNEVENGFSEARAQDSYATLDKGRLCVGDWRLIGFSWPYSNILEIVWAFSVFRHVQTAQPPRQRRKRIYNTSQFYFSRFEPHSIRYRAWFVVLSLSVCLVYKGQTRFKFRGPRFRVFGCFVFEI